MDIEKGFIDESLGTAIEEARGDYRAQKVEDFTQLRVWQDAMDLAERIYHLSSDFPSTERYGLTQQVRKCAVSIPSNVSEGQSRGGPKKFIRFLGIARGSASELRTQVCSLRKGLDIAARKRVNSRSITSLEWHVNLPRSATQLLEI